MMEALPAATRHALRQTHLLCGPLEAGRALGGESWDRLPEEIVLVRTGIKTHDIESTT